MAADDGLRVLVCCGDPGVPVHGPSGASAHLRGVARGFAALGHRVTVAALRDHDARGRHDVPLGVEAITGHGRWPRGLRTVGLRWDARRSVRRAVELGTPDLIWERSSLHADAGRTLARRLRIPHAVELNAPLALEAGRPGRQATVLAGADAVFAVSPWLVDWARGQGARRVVHLPNGSDLGPGDRDATRDRLGLHGPVAVHHGSLRPRHGVRLLGPVLDAMPDLTLLLVGDGPTLDHPRVLHHPSADPPVLADLLAASDVLLLPLAPDAPPWLDPLKLRDARAVGLPVVGSAHPATLGADVRLPVDPARWVGAIRSLVGVRHAPVDRSWRVVCAEALDALRL